MSLKRFVLSVLTAAAMSGASIAMNGTAALADYGPTHVYEIEFSLNCDNPTLCAEGFGTGGAWGWFALNGTRAGGTGDFEVTFCGHTVGGGPAGAGHMAGDVTWVNTGTFLLIFLPGSSRPIFATPSAPGHYSEEQVPFFGMSQAPGVSIQLQVVLIPTSA